MNKNEFHGNCFRDMTLKESQSCCGGSFAFDVGRLIRFVTISGPAGQWAPAAMLDALVNHCQ